MVLIWISEESVEETEDEKQFSKKIDDFQHKTCIERALRIGVGFWMKNPKNPKENIFVKFTKEQLERVELGELDMLEINENNERFNLS